MSGAVVTQLLMLLTLFGAVWLATRKARFWQIVGWVFVAKAAAYYVTLGFLAALDFTS